MSEPHVIEIGRLKVAGDAFEFVPTGDEFEVPPRRDILLTLAYDFAETSSAREDFRLAFTVDLGRSVRGGEAVHVPDLPFVHDTEQGVMSRLVPAPKGSESTGTYVVEAAYSRGSWLTRDGDKLASFRKDGKFRLVVKEPTREKA